MYGYSLYSYWYRLAKNQSGEMRNAKREMKVEIRCSVNLFSKPFRVLFIVRTAYSFISSYVRTYAVSLLGVSTPLSSLSTAAAVFSFTAEFYYVCIQAFATFPTVRNIFIFKLKFIFFSPFNISIFVAPLVTTPYPDFLNIHPRVHLLITLHLRALPRAHNIPPTNIAR